MFHFRIGKGKDRASGKTLTVVWLNINVEGAQRNLNEQKMWPTMKSNVEIPSAPIVGKCFLVAKPLNDICRATTLH